MDREVKYIVVHCSATKPSADIGRDEIDRWHKDRGWAGIGYHFVIRRDGRLERGRPLNEDHVLSPSEKGAHVGVGGINSVSVGVCLVGGVDDQGKPASNYTEPQWNTLEALLAQLTTQFPSAEVKGHRDFDPRKACPCFDAGELWRNVVNTMRADHGS